MVIRLHEIPSLYHVSGGHTFVGTYNKRWWFIVMAESSNREGKSYPGYLALWRFNTNYASKEAATKAALEWLNIPLTGN